MIKIIIFTLFSSLCFAKECLKTRASFDIGSGTTKLKVAEVDLCSKKIKKMIYERDVQVSYKRDLSKSPDKKLSDKIMSDGVKVLQIMQNQAHELGASEFIAVATAGFREASNSLEMIEKIKKEIGLKVKIISQKEEAQIGFLAGLTLAKVSKDKVVVWDIGGGSVQISTINNSTIDELDLFEGNLAAISFKDFLVGQFKPIGVKSPNPFSAYEVNFALKVARSHALEFVPREIRKKITEPSVQVIGIGGVHSSSIGDHFPLKTEYTRGDLNKLLSEMYFLTDDEIGGKYKDTSISNIILVLGYMEALEISKVTFGNVNLGEGLLLQ